jgi:DNA-binding GntR family transcriptional regulator
LAYGALRAALCQLRIYDNQSEIRFEERELSRQLGVSRSTLRQALSQLESEGLIRVVPRRGVFVVRKTRAQMLEIIAVWCALEKLGARILCESRTAGDLEQFSLNVATRRRAFSDGDNRAFSQAEGELETRLLDGARIGLVSNLADKLGFHIRNVLHRFNETRSEQQHALEEFERLATALDDRNSLAAEAVLTERHLRLRQSLDVHLSVH